MTDDKPAPGSADTQPSAGAERLREATGGRPADEAERQLWQGGYSGQAMIGSWVVAGVSSLVVLIVAGLLTAASAGFSWLVGGGLVVLLWLWLAGLLCYRKLSMNYELTTQRFVHQSGILTRKSDRIEVIDIDDVTYRQGLIQRMVGAGSILITSSDRSHPELVLPGIADVKRVADLIDDVRRKERLRRGLHIETI